jgi:hypothetical protein
MYLRYTDFVHGTILNMTVNMNVVSFLWNSALFEIVTDALERNHNSRAALDYENNLCWKSFIHFYVYIYFLLHVTHGRMLS